MTVTASLEEFSRFWTECHVCHGAALVGSRRGGLIHVGGQHGEAESFTLKCVKKTN